MVRYIRASINKDVFTTESTGMSYYDTFLTEKGLKYMEDAKNQTGSIEYMTPSQYYKECAELFGSTEEKLRHERNDQALPNLVNLIKEGVLLDMPVINWADDGQEGLHRMLAAETVYGQDVELPVLVVDVYDEDRYNQTKLYNAMNDFERYDLPKICNDVVDQMSDWDKECPPFNDIVAEFENKVQAAARNSYSADIEVEVEISGDDKEGHKLKCFLISYDGLENPSAQNACKAYIEDMYNMPHPHSDDEIDDYLANLDIDDLDLGSEFFR